MSKFDVSREKCVEVSNAIEQVAKEVFKAHGLVKGKVASKYGESYSIKIEGYGNEEVSRELAAILTAEINKEVQNIFAKHDLISTKNATHYGEGYDVTFKAEALTLGQNGVNLSSNEAKWFKMICDYRYGLDESALGKEATIKGKKHYLAGVKHWRNTYKIVTMSEGKIYEWQHERAITYFGGALTETRTASLA
jgi:uncharacterized protein YajQ (UPF0234 family)